MSAEPYEQAGGGHVRILVVDDDELTRTGLRALLSAQPDLDVVGEASDGDQVLALVERLRPDVVLIDVRMPELDGIEATRRLQQELAEPPKIIVITTFENDEYVSAALRAGAAGFVLKRAPARQIAHAVRLVVSGECLLFPDAVRRLVARHPSPPTSRRPVALTDREIETLRLVATGLSNQNIAARMFVSLETVKTHVASVLAKLQARNRTHAVVLAYKHGYVTPGE